MWTSAGEQKIMVFSQIFASFRHTVLHAITVSNLVSSFRLTKLFAEAIAKFRSLKKNAHLILMQSLEKAVWNWMDTYPQVS